MDEFQQSGARLVSELAGLTEFVRHHVVDEVASYLPLRSFYEQASHVAALCGQHGITVRFDSNIFGLKIARPSMEAFDADPYFALHNETRDGWPVIFKRILDILCSALLLILLLPLFAIVAALIKITSPGPVFFQQERVGLNKRRFLIYKFRTMVTNAEEMMSQLEKLNKVCGPVFKINDDPRITAIGKWLRRTSIDELPQFFNVLKGDMSLVGPARSPCATIKDSMRTGSAGDLVSSRKSLACGKCKAAVPSHSNNGWSWTFRIWTNGRFGSI